MKNSHKNVSIIVAIRRGCIGHYLNVDDLFLALEFIPDQIALVQEYEEEG